MNYKRFIKYINKKHIYIFDAQSRIIYNKLFGNTMQFGGGICIKKIIKKLDTTNLTLLLDSVYRENTIRSNYIINNNK
jgi:hypothetical protein